MHDTNVRYRVGLTSMETNVVILEEGKYRSLRGMLALLEDVGLSNPMWFWLAHGTAPNLFLGSYQTADRVSSMNNS